MQEHEERHLTPTERSAARAVVDFDAAEATCPACGTQFPTSATRCPDCGLNFG
jgi:predicted amidophosphoribosyltransferase